MKPLSSLFISSLTAVLLLSSCRDNCSEDPKDLSMNGCGEFFVYDEIALNGYSYGYITVAFDRENTALNADYKSFDISNTLEISSSLEAYNQPYNPYCTDVLPDTSFAQLNKWTLIAGTVQVKIVRDKNECNSNYVVDLILTDATYRDPNNKEITVSYYHFKNVLVGWFAG